MINVGVLVLLVLSLSIPLACDTFAACFSGTRHPAALTTKDGVLERGFIIVLVVGRCATSAP